eukprot:2588675-Pleurochrysis_carterae.AAC.2
MSVAARRAFFWGVPVPDVRGSFGFQLVGWKAPLEGLVTDTAPLAPSLARMLADVSVQRALQNECRWGRRFNRSVTMLQRAHPFGRRVHHDMKAYGLGDDALLQTAEVRADVARQYVHQSQEEAERAVATRHQTGAAEAPAVGPAAAPASTPSSSTSAAADSEVHASRYRRNLAAREARERAALLARRAASGVVQPAENRRTLLRPA